MSVISGAAAPMAARQTLAVRAAGTSTLTHAPAVVCLLFGAAGGGRGTN